MKTDRDHRNKKDRGERMNAKKLVGESERERERDENQ